MEELRERHDRTMRDLRTQVAVLEGASPEFGGRTSGNIQRQLEEDTARWEAEREAVRVQQEVSIFGWYCFSDYSVVARRR